MVVAAAAVAVRPAASCYSPVNPSRRWRNSWSCRASRVEAGYSQLEVRKVTYRPPGTEHNLLTEINLSLREKSFGLIFGRSGSGKTTLLQLLAGLSEPTSGSICIQKYDDSGNHIGLSEMLTSQRVGIVFQFPERYFLADTVLEEVTFGWPRQKADLRLKEQLALNLQNAFNSVGLTTISLDEDPQSLSGGFKRRLALAIQLVQTPDLLLLDEPLAGLDWKARADVVNLLKDLKKQHTILVVSHDLSWKQTASNVADELSKCLIENILQGTISTSRSLMENGNGREFEGGICARVRCTCWYSCQTCGHEHYSSSESNRESSDEKC